MDKYEANVMYEVWCRGGDPDAIDPDRVDEYEFMGIDSDEAAMMECKRQRKGREEDNA